jgi:hypothetical protein
VFEGGGSETLNEGSEIIGDAESLEILFTRSRRKCGRSGSCGSSGSNCGELRRNGNVIGERLDLISLTDCSSFDFFCFF